MSTLLASVCAERTAHQLVVTFVMWCSTHDCSDDGHVAMRQLHGTYCAAQHAACLVAVDRDCIVLLTCVEAAGSDFKGKTPCRHGHVVSIRVATEVVPDVCRAEVLADGKTNVLQTAAECAAACSSSSKCNAWQWCADSSGCPTEFGSSADLLPLQGCHLQAQKLLPGNPLFGWRPSRFVAGYNGGAGLCLPPLPNCSVPLLRTQCKTKLHLTSHSCCNMQGHV